MRIQRISVGSFGRMIGREFDLKPGFNVFYGPNESGKTTLMEFVRSTLVPTKRTKLYPERNKSNNGIIEAEENGEPYVIQLDNRQRKGTVPDCIAGMDPELFRSIHAMSYSDLDNDDVFESNDIFSKYLSIPGGQAVPAVLKAIESDMTEQVGNVPRASSQLHTYQSSIDSTRDKVAELRTKTVSYSDLMDERDSLHARLDELKEYNEKARSVNAEADRADAQRDSFLRLAKHRARRDEIRSRPLADDAADEKHRDLQSRIDSTRAAFSLIDGQRSSIAKKLPADEESLRALVPRYSSAEKSYAEYLERNSRAPNTRLVRNKFNPIVAIAGIAVMAAGAVPCIMNMGNWLAISGACVAAGIILIGAYAVARPKHEEIVRDLQNEKWISDYESEVEDLMASSNMHHLSVEGDIDSIGNVSKIIADLDANLPQWSQANTAMLEARNEMTVFLTPFGGEDGFSRSKEEYRELITCESGIEAVSEIIRDAGYDPDKPFPEIQRMEVKDGEQMDVSRNIGLLDERLDSIIKDGQLDQEIDRLSSLTAHRDAVLRDGAITILSSHILNSACADLYKNVQPEVLGIADVYLSMMTNGQYRIDSDPRNADLMVICDDGKKTLLQCSAGTRAQILLSLKLAIAKQMCGGKVPMILDDVLITFDSLRMEGACKALSEISSEMQILLFTCSDSVLKVCENMPDANIIKMF